MKLLFANPNASAHMTESAVASARQVLPNAEILGWTNTDGPPAIQGPQDGLDALPGMLSMLPRAQEETVDAIVIACFDDTGLAQARAAAHCPVIGIGQAAYHMALLRGQRFGVVTTLPVSVPVIAENIRRYGFADDCTGVRPSGLPVLQVEDGGPHVLSVLGREIDAAQAQGAQSVVLGCAGMTAHLETLQQRSEIPVIDGVRAAAALSHAMVLTR